MEMRRQGTIRWGALGAVLAVILSVAGIALGTPAPPSGGEVAVDPEFAAAGASAEPLAAPLPQRPSTTAPRVTSTVARPPTTLPAPSSTTTTTTTPRPTTSTSTTLRPAPSSWRMDDKGISMRLWIEPAAPRVGETVTFFFETWATVPTDFCCMNHVYVEGDLIYSRLHDQGPCPLAPSERRQQVSYVVTKPGPLSFQLQANRVDLCTAPPQFTTDNLHATIVIP